MRSPATLIFWVAILQMLNLFCGAFSPAVQKQMERPKPFDLARLNGTVSLMKNMEFLHDFEGTLDCQAAMKSSKWQPMVRPRLGYLDHPVWTKLKLINTDRSARSAIFFNQRPMLHYLDIIILENGTPVETIRQGFMTPPSDESRYITSHLSSFFMTIEPGGERTVVTRLKTPGIMETGWDASTLQQFSLKSRRDILALGLNWGIMLAIIIVAVISWAVQRQPQFGLLLGYSLFFTLMVVSLNGLPRILSMGLPPWFWFIGSFVFPIASVVFWIFFTQFLLKTRTTMPFMNLWLNLLTGILTAGIMAYMAGPWFPYLFSWSPIFILCAVVVCVTVILAGILAVKRDLPYARLYLFGHAVMFNGAVLMIVIGQSSIQKSLSTGLLIYPWIVAAHVTILGISLNMMTRNTRRELEAQRQSALEQSRFAVVGRIIAMVVHQWRIPLARLGTELAELTLYFKHDTILESRRDIIKEKLLPSMNNHMDHLTDTINDFSSFFSSSRHKEEINPRDLLNQALGIAGARINRLNVRAILPETDNEHSLYARPSVLTHVLLILIANALDTFEKRKIVKPTLIFDIYRENTSCFDDQGYSNFHPILSNYKKGKENNRLVITIEDNGGGIRFRPLERVFDTFVSDKGKDHMGMGLNIARRLMDEVLEGLIKVENRALGTRFTLKIPYGAVIDDPPE